MAIHTAAFPLALPQSRNGTTNTEPPPLRTAAWSTEAKLTLVFGIFMAAVAVYQEYKHSWVRKASTRLIGRFRAMGRKGERNP